MTENGLGKLVELCQSEKFVEAEEFALSIIEKGTDQPIVWKLLNLAQRNADKILESVEAIENALRLDPLDAESQWILAVTLHNLGRLEDAEQSYAAVIRLAPENSEAHNNMGNVLQGLGRFHEAEASYRRALALNTEHAGAHNNLAASLKELGRLEEAAASYRRAIELLPASEFYSNLGAVLDELDHLEEAESALRQAIKLAPEDPQAHNNLGVTQKKLGRLDAAKACFKRAIELQSNYTEACSNFGTVLQAQGRLHEAEAAYRQAIALSPSFAQAHNNLGVTLKNLGKPQESESFLLNAIELDQGYAEPHNNLGNLYKDLGRHESAISSYIRALALDPSYLSAYKNLAYALPGFRFKSQDRELYPLLTKLLTIGQIARPIEIASSIISLIKNDSNIGNFLAAKESFMSSSDIELAVQKLHQVPLLYLIMELCPIPDLELEQLIVRIRRLILQSLGNLKLSEELKKFLATLSLHCFINEYVYFESSEEVSLVDALEERLKCAMIRGQRLSIIEIMCLASYRPLHKLDWCQNIEALKEIPEIQQRLINEPLCEKEIVNTIRVLKTISNEISSKVRIQYEENPYPRWIDVDISSKPKKISDLCDEVQLQLHTQSISKIESPNILIAGCGTGQHSIETATRIAGCKVTAVDLSLTSLAYAQRKTSELDIDNIDYLQADILDLGELGRQFEIIESVGVLHHMDDPISGWKTLCNLLIPGGLMKVGLYSLIARRNISQVQENMRSKRIDASESEMRKFRQSLMESQEEAPRSLTEISDYYSLSEFRDLLFHVQEHCYDLLQIRDYLNELGLCFCGFENEKIVSHFKAFSSRESDLYDLQLWHEFEQKNPSTFLGMYQFWCQKL